MKKRRINNTAVTFLCLLILISSLITSCIKENRCNCPYYLTLINSSEFLATSGNTVLWFFDKSTIEDFYQLEKMEKDSSYLFTVSRRCDALHIWSNVSQRSYVDEDRAVLVCNGQEMDPLYYATSPLTRYIESDTVEVCFERMYAKLIVDIAGGDSENYAASIIVTGSNSGYYADCSLVDEKLVIEKRSEVKSIGESRRFTVNIGKQRSIEELQLNVIMADGSERVYNLGQLLLESGIKSSDDENFLNDIYIFIDLEEYEIKIEIDSWQNEDYVEIEY